MNRIGLMAVVFGCMVMLLGCETTNSIPYKASTANIIAIQQSLQAQGRKVRVGNIELASGVEESPMCRLMGPVKVAPGKSLPQYIKEAFMEELFAAQVYQVDAPTVIDGRIEKLDFSSVSPASWNITMAVKSNSSPGYTVSVNYMLRLRILDSGSLRLIGRVCPQGVRLLGAKMGNKLIDSGVHRSI